MTCTATHIQNSGRWRLRRPALAVVLVLIAGLNLIGFGAQSHAQVEIGGQARKYTPAQRVELFQDGVDAYRLGQYRKSYDSWLPLARAGDHAAQRNIAHLWTYGLGVQKSLSEAIPWLVLSAEGGVASSYTKLGLFYVNHPEIESNYEKAAGYFYQAARQNNQRAQYNLGLMYEYGLGVATNRKIAAAWYKFAALAGHNRSIQHLAKLDITPEISGGFPPAPEFDKPTLVGAAQPRVIDQKVDENQRTLDNLISAISRSAPNSGETGGQTPADPSRSSDDLLSDLASIISKRGSKGRGQLPASAFIDDTSDAGPVEPEMAPETINTGPAPEPAPPMTEQAEPATSAEPAGIESNITASADEIAPSMPGQKIAEAVTPAPTPAPTSVVADIQTAGLPQSSPAMPELPAAERNSALPDSEELVQSRPDTMPVNGPVAAGSNEITQNERILLSYGDQTHIVDQPVTEPLAGAAPHDSTPRIDATISPIAVSAGDAVPYIVGDIASPIEVRAGNSTPHVVGAAASPLAVRAGNTKPRALPQEQSTVSMVQLENPGEMLVATNALTRWPEAILPNTKPKSPEPAESAGKSVEIAAVSKDTRPATRPTRKYARQAERSAALAAYRRGDIRRARQIWSALASKDDVVSKFWLGRLYNRGEGVPRDPVRAYELFKSAARNGYSPAITALANVQARMTDAQLKTLERALSSN